MCLQLCELSTSGATNDYISFIGICLNNDTKMFSDYITEI